MRGVRVKPDDHKGSIFEGRANLKEAVGSKIFIRLLKKDPEDHPKGKGQEGRVEPIRTLQ